MSNIRKRLRSYDAIEERQTKLPHVQFNAPQCSFAVFHAAMYTSLRPFLRDRDAVWLSQTQHSVYDVYLLHPYTIKRMIWLWGQKRSLLPISRLFVIDRIGVGDRYTFPESLRDSGIKTVAMTMSHCRGASRYFLPSALVELWIQFNQRVKLRSLPPSIEKLTFDGYQIIDNRAVVIDCLPPRLLHLVLQKTCADATGVDAVIPASLISFSWVQERCENRDLVTRVSSFWTRTGCTKARLKKTNRASAMSNDFTSLSSLVDFCVDLDYDPKKHSHMTIERIDE